MTNAVLARATLPLGLLAAAGFLSSAGARVIDPLLHAIATEFDTSVPAVSVVIASFTLPYGLSQLLLGPLGDRFGKLRVVLGALVGYALFTAACALAPNLPALSVLRACAGAASAGLIPVCMAYIGDAVPYERRQVVLSQFLTGVVLAQTVAGPLGGAFGEYAGWRGVFLVLSAGALCVAALLALRMPSLPDRCGVGRTFKAANYAAMARHRTARLVLLAAALDGALFVGCFPFLAPYLHERFDLSYAAVGLVLGCFGLGAWGYTLRARSMLARLGESGMVLVGGLCMGSAVLLAMTSPWWQAFVVVQLALGLGFFMLHGVLQARATEMLPDARATAVATFAFMLFLGQGLGALIMGAAIAHLGYSGAFLLDAIGILALAVWLSWLLRRPAV